MVKRLRPSFTPIQKYNQIHYGRIWISVKNEYNRLELKELIDGKISENAVDYLEKK
jgi:hypothetical protein